MVFKDQAESCRKQADEFAGRPEAPFLLSVASAFDDLAIGADSRVIAAAERGKARGAVQTLTV
jgi:hypothetical protein